MRRGRAGAAAGIGFAPLEFPLASRELTLDPGNVVAKLPDRSLDRGHLRSNLFPGKPADFVLESCSKRLHRRTCFVLGTS